MLRTVTHGDGQIMCTAATRKELGAGRLEGTKQPASSRANILMTGGPARKLT